MLAVAEKPLAAVNRVYWASDVKVPERFRFNVPGIEAAPCSATVSPKARPIVLPLAARVRVEPAARVMVPVVVGR